MLPVAVQAIVNSVAFGTVLQPLFYLTLLVFGALMFNVVLNGYRAWVVEVIQRRIFVRMANDTTMRLVRLRSETLDDAHAPELVNRFLDVVTVQKAAASLLVDGLSVFMQTLIGMILLGVYHPWLLAFDVLLLIFIAIVIGPLGFGAIATAVKESKSKYAVVAWLEEIARHQIAFKSRAGAALAVSTTAGHVNDYLKYRAKHFRILLRQIVGSFLLQAIASSVLLGVGGWLVISRQLTLGQLVAAEIVVALVVSGFTKFGKHLETFLRPDGRRGQAGLFDRPRTGERRREVLTAPEHGSSCQPGAGQCQSAGPRNGHRQSLAGDSIWREDWHRRAYRTWQEHIA